MKLKKIALALIAIALSTTVLAAEKSLVDGFTFKNDSDKDITIHVGNFFPTQYKIAKHSSKFVIVSTNNQNIRLSEAK